MFCSARKHRIKISLRLLNPSAGLKIKIVDGGKGILNISALQIFISAVSLNNIYYILRKFLGHKSTIRIVEELVEITEIIGTTKKEIVQALKNDFNDYEDSVQYSSALNIKGLEAIITRNTKDYTKAQLPVFTSESYIKTLNDKR